MPSLHDALIRHQVFLEGLKVNQSGLAQEAVTRIFDFYVAELRSLDVATIDQLTMQKLTRMIATLRDLSVTLYSKYTLTFIKFLRSFTGVEVNSTARIINSVGINAKKVALSTFNKEFNDNLWKKILAGYMPYNGKDLSSTIDGVGSSLITEIENALRQGFVNKETIKAVIERLLGTKTKLPSGATKVSGGLFNKYVNDIKSNVETIIQYTSEYVNNKVQSLYYSNYVWVSVIDSSTTKICTDRDGKRYAYGDGPIPPAHRRCRSKTVPDDDNLPTQRKGFISWLQDQPNRLQDRFLGSKKADALRNGSLSADEAKSFKSENSLTLKQYGNTLNDVLED